MKWSNVSRSKGVSRTTKQEGWYPGARGRFGRSKCGEPPTATSVLILKFLCSYFVNVDCSAAEAVDRCEDIVGRFGPSERFWICVTGLDIGVDRGFQLGSRSMHTPFDLLFRQEREKTFDLIDPG